MYSTARAVAAGFDSLLGGVAMSGVFFPSQSDSSTSIDLATAICEGSLRPAAYFDLMLLQRVGAAVSRPFG